MLLLKHARSHMDIESADIIVFEDDLLLSGGGPCSTKRDRKKIPEHASDSIAGRRREVMSL